MEYENKYLTFNLVIPKNANEVHISLSIYNFETDYVMDPKILTINCDSLINAILSAYAKFVLKYPKWKHNILNKTLITI